jgi:hypothetical protein
MYSASGRVTEENCFLKSTKMHMKIFGFLYSFLDLTEKVTVVKARLQSSESEVSRLHLNKREIQSQSQTHSESVSDSHRVSLRFTQNQSQTHTESVSDSHRVGLRLTQSRSQTHTESVSDSLRVMAPAGPGPNPRVTVLAKSSSRFFMTTPVGLNAVQEIQCTLQERLSLCPVQCTLHPTDHFVKKETVAPP